jgi:hypothetical protein
MTALTAQAFAETALSSRYTRQSVSAKGAKRLR